MLNFLNIVKTIFAILAASTVCLLISGILGLHFRSITPVVVVIPPLAGGLIAGWLLRKHGGLLAVLALLPVFPIMVIGANFMTINSGIEAFLKPTLLCLAWGVFLIIGGIIGEKLYWRFNKV